jgi:two-component system sensor histidine kinase KdpD
VLFLTPALISAFLFGAPEGYLAALLATIAHNIFLSTSTPGLTWDSTDWTNLIVFSSVAMLTGNLTGRIRDEARKAKARVKSTASLVAASQEFSAAADESYIKAALKRHLENVGRTTAEVVDDVTAASPGPSFPLTADHTVVSVRSGEWVFRPMYAEGRLVGLAKWKGAGAHLTPEQQSLMEVLAEVGAVAIGRARLASAMADAELRAKADELRNALLSSVSHDLRTPLASIIASATSLDEYADRFDAATRRDLANTISEEATRLNDYVEHLLNMSRMEAGTLAPRRERFELHPAIEHVVRRRAASQRPRVEIACSSELALMGDPLLFEQALGNVLENALRYAPEGKVEISCEARDGHVEIAVADRGPGVAPAELPLLFMKYYRTRSAERVSGTGLGLSITKGLVVGMGGQASARNRSPPDTGLIVTLEMPRGTDG